MSGQTDEICTPELYSDTLKSSKISAIRQKVESELIK
jgi:hypothetical protein